MLNCLTKPKLPKSFKMSSGRRASSSSGCRVFIGHLPHNVRVDDVNHFLRKYSRRFDVLLKNGFGFIEFDDYRDADDAVYDLNGKELLGTRVTVEHARGARREDRGGRRDDRDRRSRWVEKYGPPTRTDYRVIVENLSSRVSWQVRQNLT